MLDTFGLIIANENDGLYRYYIENGEALKNDSVQNWLLSTGTVSNFLLESRQVQSRIILEKVPSGQHWMTSIIEAMKKGNLLHMVYRSYWRSEERDYTVAPYIVKLYWQRWYVAAKPLDNDRVLIFSLDRICNLTPSQRTFLYPHDFSPSDYFHGCFGVIPDDDYDIETVRLKVSAAQSNYLRDLKLHDSQREVEHNGEYSIFELRVRPTFDFQQEVLWNGEAMEVLAPQWLREEMVSMVKLMLQPYLAADGGKQSDDKGGGV